MSQRLSPTLGILAAKQSAVCWQTAGWGHRCSRKAPRPGFKCGTVTRGHSPATRTATEEQECATPSCVWKGPAAKTIREARGGYRPHASETLSRPQASKPSRKQAVESLTMSPSPSQPDAARSGATLRLQFQLKQSRWSSWDSWLTLQPEVDSNKGQILCHCTWVFFSVFFFLKNTSKLLLS